MAGSIKRNEDVIWREIDDSVVIIRSDAMATFTLNKTAARIWKLCDGTRSVEEITADIFKQFEVLREQADADVKKTLKKFEEMGLLRKE